MKTYIFIALISAFFNPAYFFAHVPAYQFPLEEEAYVEDVNFDSEKVVFAFATQLNEEAYIDDIPFNTHAVVMSHSTTLPEETYVDDIPFDTHAIAMNVNVKLPEEAYVDDIPFDTECVVKNRDKKSDPLGKSLIKGETDSLTGASAFRSPFHVFAMKPEIY